MLWAALLLPELALDAIRRTGIDALAPIALVSGPPQKRQITSCTTTARREGVRVGHSVATARALLPSLLIVEDEPGRTKLLRHLLVAWAYSYSSDVGLLADDVIVFEVGKSLSLFGPWERWESRLRNDLDELGITYRLAIAPVASAAAVFACHHDGFFNNSIADMRKRLRAVPLPYARLPEVGASLLTSMGLRTLGALFDLPRAGIARRCGEDLVQYLDQLQGSAPEPLARYRPPDEFIANVDFEMAVHATEVLLFPVRRMVHDLCTFLRARDGGVEQIELVLTHDVGTPTSWIVRTPAPERDPAQWMSIIRLRLDSMRLPAPVIGIALRAKELPPFVPVASSLFDTTTPTDLSWNQLVARLEARLGDGAVQALHPAADHRPEYAWSTKPETTSTIVAGKRPLWLLPRPIRLRDHAFHIVSGPERIESGWWDGEEAQRDYYVLQTSLGQRAWAFRPAGATEGEWLLHGWFA